MECIAGKSLQFLIIDSRNLGLWSPTGLLEPLADYIMLLGVGVAVGCLLEGEKTASVKEELKKPLCLIKHV